MSCLNCLAFLTLLGCSFANPLSDFTLPAECTKGQYFWCKGLSSAKKCDTVDFCIENVWSLEPSEDQFDSSSLFQQCVNWISIVRSLIIEENFNVDSITSLKIWICEKDEEQDNCTDFIDQNIPEIIKVFQSKMSDSKVCDKLMSYVLITDTDDKNGDPFSSSLRAFYDKSNDESRDEFSDKMRDLFELEQNIIDAFEKRNSNCEWCSKVTKDLYANNEVR
jgi:hypothetical protein